ncbi:MAG: hypothetical protein HYV09_04770 [Deltaproteobacteria bacterium]|nr:hypothetical protein [Deltaproteobacteria bacterium]
MSRVTLAAGSFGAALVAVVSAIAACGPEAKGGGAAPPPGAGYGAAAPPGMNEDDLRVLSRDDCVSLRDHQIDIAVAAELGETDPAQRLEVEAKVRAQMKPATDAWVKRCSGKRIRGKDLRCMKEATTPEAFVACGAEEADAATSDAARTDTAASG